MFKYLDANAVAGKTITEIHKLLVYKKKFRGSVTKIANRLGNPEPMESDWLVLTPKDKMPQPEKVAYPKPPKAADGSLIYERIPNKGEVEVSKPPANDSSPTTLKRRHDDVNGIAEPSKLTFELSRCGKSCLGQISKI